MNKIIIALTAGVALIGGAFPAFAETTQVQSNMIGQLHKGSKGDSVKLLQAMLAADPSIYPEGVVNGYFGALTAKAVKRFQEKHGLESVGNVGPRTLAKLNSSLASSTRLGLEDRGDGKGKRPCAIVPPGQTIAPGWQKKHSGEDSEVPKCQTLPKGISDKESDWRHGSSTSRVSGEHARGEDSDREDNENERGHGTTTPRTSDVTAPSLYGVAISNIASSSVTVSWNTNELTTSKVYFGTTTPLSLASAQFVSLSPLSGAHSTSLTGLSPSSTYYYVIELKDASGNTATSTQASFVTTAI